MKTKILIFIPFYNCEKQLPRVLSKLVSHKAFFTQVLLIDNRSEDQSLKVAQSWASQQSFPVTVLQNSENYNLGGSHKVAFDFAKKSQMTHLLVYHGDDQADISDFSNVLCDEKMLSYDCVLGSRFSQYSRLIGYSRFRILGNHILNFLCSVSTQFKVEDMGSGLNLYRLESVSDPRIQGFPNNLTFNVYLLFHSIFTKQQIRFHPISWKEEDQISNAKVFKQMSIILKMLFLTFIRKDNLYHNPLEQKYHYEVRFQS